MITKYKLNDLAKDLKLNANDIIECLAHQYGAKKTVSSLTPEEVNYVLEVFSQKHQVENFNAYFADKTATKKAKEEPKAEKPKKEAPKAEPKKEEPKKEAPKAEVKKEQPKKEAPKPEVKKEEPKKEAPKPRVEEKKQPAKKQDRGERTRLVTNTSSNVTYQQEEKKRVVDTRGSYVNIDKYNDKYDNLADAKNKGGCCHSVWLDHLRLLCIETRIGIFVIIIHISFHNSYPAF